MPQIPNELGSKKFDGLWYEDMDLEGGLAGGEIVGLQVEIH
jgi:hypothetical protein